MAFMLESEEMKVKMRKLNPHLKVRLQQTTSLEHLLFLNVFSIVAGPLHAVHARHV